MQPNIVHARESIAVPPIADDRFAIGLEPELGIVCASDLKLSTIADVDDYAAALSRFLAVARLRFGRALLLADLRQSPIRTQDAAARLRLHNQTLYRAGERAALLIESSLMLLQLRRNLVPDIQEIFASRDEAVAWLLAASGHNQARDAS